MTDLFDFPDDQGKRPYTPGPTAEQDFSLPIHIKWLLWHRDNPTFYPLFRSFALQLIGAGRTKIGAAAIFERVRWESMMQTDGDAWKLNNTYRAYFSRLFMVEHPQYPDVFETRVVGYEPPVEFFKEVLKEANDVP